MLQNKPIFYDPVNHEWKLVNNKYHIDWFVDKQMPQSLSEVLVQPTDDEEPEDDISADSDNDCTESDTDNED